jgi:hypothetical protein
VNSRLSLTNSTRTPLRVRAWKRARKSSRLRASLSMLCTTTVSPSWAEPQQFPELRPGAVPARGLVRENPVQSLAFELAFLVLVQRTNPRVPDPLSGHCCLQLRL